MRGYLDDIGRERHTAEAFLWGMHRTIAVAAAQGAIKASDIREYPEYEGLEEGQLPENWEEAASSSPLVRRVEATQSEPSTGDVQ